MLRPTADVLRLQPYRAGGSSLPDPATAIRLDANESPFGPSPAAVQAAAAAAARAGRYPDSRAEALRGAIGQAHGIDPDAIVCGHGSEEMISLLARAFLNPGDELLTGRTSFAIFRLAALAAGGEPVLAEERELAMDADSVLAAVTPRTKLVFWANPNNPTGAFAPLSEIARLRDALPEHVLLVFDAAYAEYVDDPAYGNPHMLVEPEGRVAVLRTFSKAYGLAAARLGWLHAPAVVCDALERLRPVFNVAGPSAAAAMAALEDREHLALVVREAARSRRGWRELADRLGLKAKVEYGNFAFLEHAPGLAEHLTRANIAVLPLKGYGLADGVRVSFGTRDEDEAVWAATTEWARLSP
ncbi:MAG TPA: histidinol-phosphate transaminase [Caulobacteraceae bacterium]|jgi:histidinol-phosphate aminotransferase